jgi:ABC-2 type transport system ATP-binding protein
MSDVILSVRDLVAGYGRREVFRSVTFQLPAGQSLGVIGPSGAGKTTLLRMLVGLLTPRGGEVRISGLAPRDALVRSPIAYFAGDATLPGSVRAAAWASLAVADLVIPERRRIRTLSRGTRQLLGLRTVLGRHPLDLVVLDEPWEGLDVDGARWLSSTIEVKRDRGAAVVLSSHRLHDLAGVCDAYLCLLPHNAVLMKAHEISPVGPVTAVLLADLFEKLRSGSSLRVAS